MRHILLIVLLLAGSPASSGAESREDTRSSEEVLKPLRSPVFEAAGYDGHRKTLILEFKSGALYEYWPVSRKTYQTFLRTDYKGSFFHAHIRTSYQFRRIEQVQLANFRESSRDATQERGEL